MNNVTENTATRHDPRSTPSDDPSAALRAWHGDMDNGAWTDHDEAAFWAARDDEEGAKQPFDLNQDLEWIEAYKYLYGVLDEDRYFWDDKEAFDGLDFDIFFEVKAHGITWMSKDALIFRADQKALATDLYDKVMRDLRKAETDEIEDE